MTPIPFAEIRAWMFDAALPLWGTAGVDRARGGFFEELDRSGRPTPVAFKRTRAMCRQVYVFSHASLLGWKPGADLSAMGCEYLVDKAWLGPDRGWARRLTAGGDVLDPTPDLYDLAFVLFALLWRYKASKDTAVLQRAHDTLDFIERQLRHPSGEGFWHESPSHGPRQQNPHMHLLEASLVGLEATGDPRFRDLADEIVRLFRTRFFDGRTLGELFTDDWQRDPGDRGRIVEPGHQFEWAWILCSYFGSTGIDVRTEAGKLREFAEYYGVDRQTGATFNQLRDDGTVLDRGSRTWPNTERLKGALAMFEHVHADLRDAIAGSSRLLLDRYLAATPPGSWIDHFDASGRPVAAAAPTSTLYHVFLAFAEVLRLEGKLSA